MSRTKIICTIGPAVNSLEMMIELMEAGMNVARLNLSHGTQEEHQQVIDNLKEARRRKAQPLAIMLDTKGPEIRIGKIRDNEQILLEGQRWLLVNDVVAGDAEKVTITPAHILDDQPIGTKVLFDDGYISSKIVEKNSRGVLVEIENSRIIRSGKGVNVPNAILNLPAITEKDIADIRFGCKNDIDIIAASFVRSPDHVLEIKRLIAEEKKPETLVLAKIENSEGLLNFDAILQVSDGIMIARGDLGVEIPLSQVPKLQKMMIRKSYLAGKPAITATQMLESMILNPRPTRAEVSDVANAIYDSSSAVMLSGETAVGKYPIETVNMMKSIIDEAEADFDYRSFFNLHSQLIYLDVPSSVTLATVKTAYSSNARAIFAFTSGGSTARLLSRLRPSIPIIAMTSKEKCYHQLAISWGVVPHLADHCGNIGDSFTKISTFALKNQLVSIGDLVIVTAGSPFGVTGTTNMMIVESIGDVLVRGITGWGCRIHGNVSLVLSPESKKTYSTRGQLLVIAKCDETYLPFIREASGIILQNHIDDVDSERYAMEYAHEFDIPLLLRADGAASVLKEGQLVTLDPEKAIVYKGVLF